MPRIVLDLPEEFIYKAEIPVRLTDLNPGNHVGNDQMISLLSAARFMFFDHLELDEFNIFGHNIAVTDLATMYLKETLARDTLIFEVGITDFNKYGADFIFRVSQQSSGQVAALAKTGFVFLDKTSGKVSPVPSEFKAMIEAKLNERN